MIHGNTVQLARPCLLHALASSEAAEAVGGPELPWEYGQPEELLNDHFLRRHKSPTMCHPI